jgi:hypothetical protein
MNENPKSQRPTDEDLILYFYGEAPDGAAIAAELAASAATRERYAALERVLRAADDLAVPEPSSGYSARVWRRLEPQLPARRPRLAWFSPPRLAWAAALLAVVGAAYIAGRAVQTPAAPERPSAFSAESRERILEAAVAHHLEVAERLLVELDNGGPTLSADLASERHRAEELVEANRLYRRAARESRLTALGSLLEELEPFLLEVANAPASKEAGEPLRARLAETDLLFKVRILSDRLQRETTPPPPPRAGDVL